MESVILLDEDGVALGSADKQTVHDQQTALHLAFSCYLFDQEGRLLLTKRAATKVTWPGVWTNSACGHPEPGEAFEDGVRRRVGQELGVTLTGLTLALPAFRYRITMANGVVENEMCPVYWAQTVDDPRPDPAEVDDHVWVDWLDFSLDVLHGRRAVSPWCVLQVQQLVALGPDPAQWRGDPSRLPPAAQT